MLQVEFNAITSGCSGKFGNVVYRRRGNKVVVAKLSGKKHAKGTKAQKLNRDHFAAANHYATSVMANEAQAVLYKHHTNANINVRNLAVRDFRTPPTIDSIDVTAYKGMRGQRLSINATDDFMVSKVSVSIFNSNSELIETGRATVVDDTSWEYLTTQQLDDTNGGRVVVTVMDMPGNAVTEEVYVHASAMQPAQTEAPATKIGNSFADPAVADTGASETIASDTHPPVPVCDNQFADRAAADKDASETASDTHPPVPMFAHPPITDKAVSVTTPPHLHPDIAALHTPTQQHERPQVHHLTPDASTVTPPHLHPDIAALHTPAQQHERPQVHHLTPDASTVTTHITNSVINFAIATSAVSVSSNFCATASPQTDVISLSPVIPCQCLPAGTVRA